MNARRDPPTLTVPAPTPQRGRRRFGATWWGAAWLAALEIQAELDPNRLPRGRSYARSGAVGDITLRPGSAEALVRGRRPAPYRVRLAVRSFDDPSWDRIVEAVAARVGHAAALLDGELVPEVDEDVRQAGVSLLPQAHELTVRCSCPDHAVPCKHAAAVCYVLCDVLDADPFALLLLRGRSRRELLDALRSHRAGQDRDGGAAPPVAGGPTGIPALQALRRSLPASPGPLRPPVRPGRPVPLPAGDDCGIDVAALESLVADTAARAFRMLTGQAEERQEDASGAGHCGQ